MKKRPELEQQQNHHDQDLEVMKAVAQAWYSHSGSSRPMSEFDAPRGNFKGKPSRFKLEALNKPSSSSSSITTMVTTSHSSCWDFKQSLWDPYELVTVSRRIETGLALDNPFDEFLCCSPRIQQPRGKLESKNSLRSLLKHSRRFIASKIAKENDT